MGVLLQLQSDESHQASSVVAKQNAARQDQSPATNLSAKEEMSLPHCGYCGVALPTQSEDDEWVQCSKCGATVRSQPPPPLPRRIPRVRIIGARPKPKNKPEHE